jgi:hypothetical protein
MQHRQHTCEATRKTQRSRVSLCSRRQSTAATTRLLVTVLLQNKCGTQHAVLSTRVKGVMEYAKGLQLALRSDSSKRSS